MKEQASPRVGTFARVFALFMERERPRSGLTQAEVAKRIGITETAVGHWETGSRTPNGENLAAVFRVFGLSMAAGLRVLLSCAVDVEEHATDARAVRKRLKNVAEPIAGTKRAFRSKKLRGELDHGRAKDPSDP